MPLFNYRAIDEAGHRRTGKIDALNPVDLEMRLKRMSLDLIAARPVSNRSWFGRGRVPRRDLIHFCFELEMLIKGGVPILDGLADLRDTLETPRFREIVTSLIEDIEGGRKLSQALARQPKAFSNIFVNLVRTGETTGRLPDVLRSLTESLKWEDELAAQNARLILYPAFVGTIVAATTVFLMIYLVPQLKLFVRNMGQTFPLQTQALFFLSDALSTYWYAFVGVPVVAALLGKALIHANPLVRLRFDEGKLKLPVFGDILRKLILARFTSTFALMYSSGIPIIDAVRAAQDIVGNLAIRRGLERVEQLISAGTAVTAAFHSAGLFPPLVIRMLRVGETTGNLDSALTNVSYFYNRDVKESVAKLQQLIEPALTVCLGLLLGWIMLAVLGPVYDVITTIAG